MQPRRLVLALSCIAALAACGGDAAEEQAPPPPAEKPANPVTRGTKPARDAAAKAEADMKAAEQRMNNEAAAAADIDTTATQ